MFQRIKRILGSKKNPAQADGARSPSATILGGLAINMIVAAVLYFLRPDDQIPNRRTSPQDPIMTSESSDNGPNAIENLATSENIRRWSDAMNDRDLPTIASLLKEDSNFGTLDFVPRDKLPFYHSATYAPVNYAVMQNDLEVMETLLEGGVEPSFGFSVESVEMAHLIIRYGGKLDTWDNLQYSPAVMACWFPNAKLMGVLLEAGADPNYPKQNSGATGLMILAERAEDDVAIEIAKLMIKHGADVNQKAHSGLEDAAVRWDAYTFDVRQGHETALHWAANHGKSKYTKFLIEQGADVNAKTITIHRGEKNADDSLKFEPFHGEMPIDWAFEGGDEATIRLLGGGDALETVAGSAHAGMVDRVRALLESGADPNGVDPSMGKTAVELALKNNHIAISRILVAGGAKWPADVTTAIRKGFPTVVQKLLDEDGSLKAQLLKEPEKLFLQKFEPDENHAASIRAVMDAEPRMEVDLVLAGYLADAKAARQIIDRHEATIATALSTAPTLAYYFVFDPELLKDVLDAGANIEARGIPYGGTPLHKAILTSNFPSMQLLLDRGANVEAHMKPVWQTLDMVVCKKTSDYTMMKPLLDAGADPNVVYHNGYTALDIVNHRDRDRTDDEYEQMIEWLRAAGAKTSAELQDERRLMNAEIESVRNGESGEPLHLVSTLMAKPTEGKESSTLTPLQWIEYARHLLDQGDEINARHPATNHTPLSLAVENGQLEYVRLLLRRGAPTNIDDPPATSPLAIADRRGFTEIASALTQRMNRYQISRWQRAVESDDVKTVLELVKKDQTKGVQCLQKFRRDGTWYLVDPLCEAAQRNCIPIAKAMLDHDRLPNYTVGMGQYLGEIKGAHCLAWAGSAEMRQFLIDNGADPTTIENMDIPKLDEVCVPLGQTTGDLGLIWQLAIEQRDEEQVRELLNEHSHLSRQVIMDRWRDGRMGHRSLDPLYQCAQSGHLGIVKMMVESGYDRSRLQGAFELAAPEVAQYLLDEGVDAAPDVGFMAYIGHHEALKFWLSRSYKPHGGMLHDAVCGRGRFRGNKDDNRGGWPDTFRETARVLIGAGMDVNERNAGGNQKYDGCKPWVTNRETPLHFAAGNWDPKLVQLLLDAGADRTVKNDLGETPYDWAVRFEAPEEVKQLLSLDPEKPGVAEQ